MATRGKRPKPTVLHELHGTTNVTRHRARATEPKAEGDLLADPPPHLTEGQADAWRYAVEHAPKGVMRRIDASMLFIWVEAADRHRRAVEAQAKIDAGQPGTPFLVKRNGELAVSPYLGIITTAAVTMVRAASELGFSPAARPRLAISNPGVVAPNDSPWKQLRAIQGGKAS